MRGLEAEAFVEAVGVGAGLVGGELHQRTPRRPRVVDRVPHQRLAQLPAALAAIDAYRLDLRAHRAHPRHARDDGDLQAADDRASLLRDDEIVAALALHRAETLHIGLRQRVRVALAATPEVVVGEQPHDARQVGLGGDADRRRRRGPYAAPPWASTQASFNPTTPSRIIATQAIFIALAGSPSSTAPNATVPTTPMPVQIA